MRHETKKVLTYLRHEDFYARDWDVHAPGTLKAQVTRGRASFTDLTFFRAQSSTTGILSMHKCTQTVQPTPLRKSLLL